MSEVELYEYESVFFDAPDTEHVALAVYGNEYSFNPLGVEITPIKPNRPRAPTQKSSLNFSSTSHRCNIYKPKRIQRVGVTNKSRQEIQQWIHNAMSGNFAAGTYRPILNNCQVFTNTFAQWLIGEKVKKEVFSRTKEFFGLS